MTNEELDDAAMPSHKCTCEERAWSGFFGKVAPKACWPPIKVALTNLVEQAKQKWL